MRRADSKAGVICLTFPTSFSGFATIKITPPPPLPLHYLISWQRSLAMRLPIPAVSSQVYLIDTLANFDSICHTNVGA